MKWSGKKLCSQDLPLNYSITDPMLLTSLISGCHHHQWNVLPSNNVHRSLKITHCLATLHIFLVCLVFHCPKRTFQTLLLTTPPSISLSSAPSNGFVSLFIRKKEAPQLVTTHLPTHSYLFSSVTAPLPQSRDECSVCSPQSLTQPLWPHSSAWEPLSVFFLISYNTNFSVSSGSFWITVLVIIYFRLKEKKMHKNYSFHSTSSYHLNFSKQLVSKNALLITDLKPSLLVFVLPILPPLPPSPLLDMLILGCIQSCPGSLSLLSIHDPFKKAYLFLLF